MTPADAVRASFVRSALPERVAASLLLSALLLMVAGCGDADRADAGREADQSYVVRGVLQSITSDSSYATIAHETIPGYMDAMSMSFAIADTDRVPRLAPGDSVVFTLVSGPEGDRIHGLSRPVE